MSPSILITCATGGIGKTLCSSLAARGYDIIAVSRSLARAQALVDALPAGAHIAAEAEVTDGASLMRLASPQDVADAVYAAIALLTNSTGDIIHVNGGRPLGL